VELNLRPTVSRPVCLGVRTPFGLMVRFYMFFSLTCTSFLMYGALSDERTGVYFAVHITHCSESRRSHNNTLLSHLRLGSLFVASYDSQYYGGGILIRLHKGRLPSSGIYKPSSYLSGDTLRLRYKVRPVNAL
jgi:hypothetical protein